MIEKHAAAGEIVQRTLRELQLARDADDETRLRVLEDLYSELETELERDVGQTNPSRR